MSNTIKTSDFEAIRLKLASPEDINEWSYGEVLRPETINYRTQKPEKDGLFCEKIFGPSKDWECYCGKYKKIRYKGVVCDRCGVEVTRSIVRRERMGHISLATPVSHIWFLRGLSCEIGLILDMPMQALERVIYFANFVITDVNEDLKNDTIEQIKEEYKQKKKQIANEFGDKDEEESKNNDSAVIKARDEKLAELESAFSKALAELKEIRPLAVISESVYQELSMKYGHIFEAGIGADAIRKLLVRIDLDKTTKRLEEELDKAVDSRRDKLIKRLKLCKSMKANNIRPEWMILNVVPVIPPDLRPMVSLDGGRFATSDLNDLYRRIINRNNRLKQLIELNAPEVIARNERRMLQEAVDALIDNAVRHTKTVVASTGQKRSLKSLADSLKGKQGRFRQNLLGKRVDYSGRSVIVVNPKLKLFECGLPKTMAMELFKPFVISKLIELGFAHNVRGASRVIESNIDEVWDILEEITNKSYVLLNRAPTLHRLGIQAFKPILIEGKAIQIHPLVCVAFNADFDGDQMAVHVPLTDEAMAEAGEIMLSSHNLLKPATGDPVVAPTQEIVWGAYYITLEIDNGKEESQLKSFSSEEEVRLAEMNGYITMQEPIRAFIPGQGIIKTTAGRVLFNEVVPDKLKYINETLDKGKLKKLVKKCLSYYGEDETVKFLDDLKNKCYAFITESGLSWGMSDLPVFPERQELIDAADEKVNVIKEQYEEGLLTESERYARVIELWTEVKEKITALCKEKLPKDGPIFSMIESGARGSWAQLTQIIGMKGLVTSPSGDIIELPVKGNFKKGFDVLEYFISTHGVRKGLSDTALRTANAGYLTRRLVDVSQDVVITKEDCGDTDGIIFHKKEGEEFGVSLMKRIVGRFMASDLKTVKGKVLLKAGEFVTEELAEEFKDEDVETAHIRSVLSCKLNRGVCSKCYGADLGYYNRPVTLGTAVGIIAAQSIGEPGTQLTMRTFHTGGVAGGEDITQGLPRVEEIFEGRLPKHKAFIADVDGKIVIETAQKVISDDLGRVITSGQQSKVIKIYYEGTEIDKYNFSEVKSEDKSDKTKLEVKIADGDTVKAGQVLFKLGKKEVVARASGKADVEKKCIKVHASAEKYKEYSIPKGFAIVVKDGMQVKKGDRLTEGSLDLQQLYRLQGKLEAQKYIIKEIQYVYSSQGQPLNDKHIEIIAKQMFSRVFVIDAGDSNLLHGEIVEKAVFQSINDELAKADKKLVQGDNLLLGITKSSLTTHSFLSAASFQNTSNVLVNAALNGKIDYLEGLKENVIIGRLIPTGTGFNPDKKRKFY